MTQSGQGEEPSARQAREGIVLPSDGGEPLLPGMAGAPAPTAPAGGQAWSGQWGPGQQTPQPGEGWPPAADQQWEAPAGPEQPPAAAHPGPLPPEGAPAPSYGGQGYSYGGQDAGYGTGTGPYGQQSQYPQQDPYQQGQQQGSYQQGSYQQGGQQDAYQQGQQQDPYQQGGQPHPATQGSAGPLPPAHPGAGAPLPPAADAATQYLPPVPGGPAGAGLPGIPGVPGVPGGEAATQYLPPIPAAPAPADEGATQYIPPVPPAASGALPAESGAEETRYLGRTIPQSAPAPGSSDAEATQYIPPFAAAAQADGDRQPPAEFDSLFRSGPGGGDGPAGSTQQLPLVQQPDAYPGPAPSSYNPGPSSYSPAQPSYDAAHDRDDRPRGRSRVPLIAAIGVGLVVVGVGAGALLSGGGGDKSQGNDDKTVAAASPATQGSASPSADPARAQAVELDKLLADSGSSRASVIQAVADVRRCDNLDQAASDLRDAAKQRTGLVTRLGKLSVDKLPANGQLTDALTKAWQASAAADDHYAAWADQAKGHKGCHKGHARVTGQTQAANKESGTASVQKTKAAALWNAIARKYGLTQRQPTQL
ncbi:hypothetical protein ACWCV9_30955 [Streptomyces sp. NPDC001606]